MKKSILFLAALIVISSDFIAQGSIQEKQTTTQTEGKTNSTKKNRKAQTDSTAKKSAKKKNEEARKMDNYKNNEPAGGSNAEQQHMDSTINNHR